MNDYQKQYELFGINDELRSKFKFFEEDFDLTKPKNQMTQLIYLSGSTKKESKKSTKRGRE